MSRGVIFDSSSARRIAESVRVTERLDKVGKQRRRPTAFAGAPVRRVIKFGHTLVTANRWRYGYKDAIRDHVAKKWIVDPNGQTVLSTADEAAYNVWESHNDGAGAEGMGAAVGTVGSATITLLPIMDGAPLLLTPVQDDEGQQYYEFFAPNDRGVACA